MATASNKVCTSCGLDKAAEDYYRDKRAPHGLCTQCKQCMNDAKEAKRKIDPERTRAEWRRDYRENKDRYVRACETYRSRNAERFREWSRNNSNKNRVTSSSVTGAAFYEWVSAQAKDCAWCGVSCEDDFQVDHIVPIARGGEHEIENLTISCRKCNRAKGSMLPAEFLHVARHRS